MILPSSIRNTILLCVCVPWSTLLAQPAELKLQHLTLREGLSQSTVYAIVQDAQGFMWFGTQDGLNRFDGYTITVFKHDPADSNSIADNSIWSLLSDSRGDLWIGTLRGGVDRYVLAENRFIHYTHRANDSTSISENNVISMFEDSDGALWFGTLNNWLNRFDRTTQRFSYFVFDAASAESLQSNTVWSMSEDRHRNLWVGTWRGVRRLSLDDPHRAFQSYHHHPHNRASLAGENIRVVFTDRHGTVWIGTWGAGLDRYDERRDGFTHFVHDPKNPRSISSNFILSIYEDTKGNLWVGTNDAGLNKYDPATQTFDCYRTNPHDATSLNNDQVSALWEDRSGILWIGTGAGGVNIFDWRKNRFTHYRDVLDNPHDLNGNDVWAILEDREGILWIGTYGNGVNRFDRRRNTITSYTFNPKNPRSLSHNNVLSMCEGSDGSVWIGTEGGGLNRFDRKTNSFIRYKHDPANPNSISLDEVTALHEDRVGNLWIGNNGGGIDRLELRTNQVYHYRPKENDPNALSGTSVMCIAEDSRSTIWVGSFGGGVHVYNSRTNSFVRPRVFTEQAPRLSATTVLSIRESNDSVLWIGTQGSGLYGFRLDRGMPTGQFKHYTEASGLPNDVVYGILVDNRGRLWLSTNKGIAKFDPRTEVFRTYDVNDGLQGNEFNQGAYFKSARGELFFGGINGVNAFFPDSIKDNLYVPPVYVTSFKVFDKDLPLRGSVTATKEIQLSYDQNFFSFEFVALSYSSPDKNRYMYMLEGLDKNWIAAPALRRYASYTNLDPGSYVLRVKGSNNDGIWNTAGVAMEITIAPPYWKTWWFRILAALTVAAILYGMYRYRVTRLLEIERIRSSIATDLHDDIGSTLTEIALYSDVGLRELRARKRSADGAVTRVESLLEDIGTTSRGLIDALNDIVWAVDPKNDSFEFLLLRMKTHAARMFDAKGINYEIDIPEELSHLHLPLGFRRRFYLIFKEAVNNIIRHAHPSKVLLRIRKTGRSLVMTIVDDGRGFDLTLANEGNGLTNMKKRAESLNGSLSIHSAVAKGTTVRLEATIP